MKTTFVFVIGVLIAAWSLHDLTTPGESATTLLTIINVVAVVAGFTIAAGAIIVKVKAKTPTN